MRDVPERARFSLVAAAAAALVLASCFGGGGTRVATQFVILDPTDGTADNPITVTVQAQDQYGQVVTTYDQDVTLVTSCSATGGGLVNIVSGVGSLDISDTVVETVNLSLTDSQGTGLIVSSTQNVVFAVTVHLTDANFDELTCAGVALVDFWATWCPPCQTQGPIVDQIAEEYDGVALVGKVNVDENPVTTTQFVIAFIPTLVILKDGTEVWRAVGLQSAETLRAALDAALAL